MDQARPLVVVVVDRLLHNIAAAFGGIGDPRLVLKGGTLLRVCALEDHRFSEDLDFDFVGTPAEFHELAAAAVPAAAATSGVPLTVRAGTANIIVGWEHEGLPQSIKLESTFLSSERAETQDWNVAQRYSEIPPDVSIMGYTLVEVASDKLKALARRARGRDIYDLATLVRNGVDMTAAWSRYVDSYADPQREYGKRNHPSDIRSCYLPRAERAKQEWQAMAEDGWFPPTVAFDDALAVVDASVKREVESWKSSLARGELHQMKFAHREQQRKACAALRTPPQPETPRPGDPGLSPGM